MNQWNHRIIFLLICCLVIWWKKCIRSKLPLQRHTTVHQKAVRNYKAFAFFSISDVQKYAQLRINRLKIEEKSRGKCGGKKNEYDFKIDFNPLCIFFFWKFIVGWNIFISTNPSSFDKRFVTPTFWDTTKGQLISKCPFGVFKIPKHQRCFLGFLP